MRYLVDASAIIHLSRIGELDLLRETLGRIHVTKEVADEVRAGPDAVDLLGGDRASWIVLLPPQRAPAGLGLGQGEASLISAAGRGDRLVLDDAQARAVASARGLDHVGLLGLLIAAAKTGKLPVERALAILDGLVATEFRVAPELYSATRQAIDDKTG